ncbi:MAG: DUF6318 family protein [Actinomyces sp.]|nr:DUF6318 family protein [Actinomyces sp.]
MEISPLSDRSVAEEEEQAFLAPTSRRKKRALAARRAALRPWAVGIGLTVVVAVAAVGAYTLGASIGSWNDRPSTAATPTVHPAPMPSASSEPAMSGGYTIGPDGVLVRPAEFAADTYTKPELPEAAKENTERGAELAAEHYVASLSYAWNTGDTQTLASLSAENVPFADGYINAINSLYSNGWAYGNSAAITSIVEVEPVTAEMGAPPNTIGVLFHVTTTNGTSCQGQRIVVSDNEYTVSFALFMTWQGDRWLVTDGNIPHGNDK